MVKVYSTESCPYCTMVKRFLDSNNVEYENINVGEDREKAQEMIDKSGQMGVPVVDINGTIIIGYDKNKILAALKGA